MCWQNVIREHDYATDKALWQYTQDLKNQFLRNAPPINKVMYDNKDPRAEKRARVTYRFVSRVQGGKLKAKQRSASLPCFATRRNRFAHDRGAELAHLKKSITKRFTSCAVIWNRSTTSGVRHPAVANAVVAWAGQNLKMMSGVIFSSFSA